MTQSYPSPSLERITSQHVVEAMKLVKTGTVYDLGTNLGGNMPRGPEANFGPFRWLNYRTPSAGPTAGTGFQFSMELIMGSPHVSSHIDGLAHIQADDRIFEGHTVDESLGDFGWAHHGIETVQPIVARGVMLDIPRLLGVEKLEDRYAIGSKDLAGAAESQNIDIEPGDVVLVRTGKINEYHAGQESYYGDQAGVDVEGALWLYDRGMSVLGTDTSGTEPLPFADPKNTTHRVLIVERGVHLLEVLDLNELAQHEIYEFLFMCAPHKIVGATGSWVRPIAVV